MDLYRNLNRKDFQFDFYIESGKQGVFDFEIKKSGGRIFYSKTGRIGSIPNFLDFNYVIRSNHYNCVCVYNQWSGWYLKLSQIHCVHVRIACSVTSLRNNSLCNCLKNIIKRNTNKYATFRIAVSKEAGEWLFGRNELRKGDIKIIPNAIDAKKYKFSQKVRVKIRNEFKIDDELTIMHVGNIRKVKNQAFVIDIVTELVRLGQNVKCVFVGKELSGENSIDDLKKKAMDQKVNENIIFAGQRSDIENVLQAADVFVFPSYYEGFPGAVLEAQASGLPCIISDSITDEVIVNDSVKKFPLSFGALAWAKEIMKYKTTSKARELAWQKVRESGYDVKEFCYHVEEFLNREVAK